MGGDAVERLRTEVDAIRRAAGRLPVPRIASVDEHARVVTFSYVAGRHGQELIEEGRAGRVLERAGEVLRALHAGSSSARLHGDFGPQNLLYDPHTLDVVAVLDWEFARDGDPVEDLAWAEWIVRMHHPPAVGHLESLFHGYGEEPRWARRRTAMIAACERHEKRARTLADLPAADLWARRAHVTAHWEP